MKKILSFLCVFTLVFPAFGNEQSALDNALKVAYDACAGIGDELADLKKMAGIGAAVSGVGVATGGVALGTGIAKAKVDNRLDDLTQEILKIAMSAKDVKVKHIEVDWTGLEAAIAETGANVDNRDDVALTLQQKEAEQEKLAKKSKTLGNVRTGMLGTSTVTNIVGALVANESKVKGGIKEQVDACLAAVRVLEQEYNQARITRAVSEERLAHVNNIIIQCGEWQMTDLSVVNSGARGAVISSGVAAGAGAIGTVTSVMANSDSVRGGEDKKEKNLNTVSNVAAGGATVASVAATVFNVKQVNAVKKIVSVADNCEGAF